MHECIIGEIRSRRSGIVSLRSLKAHIDSEIQRVAAYHSAKYDALNQWLQDRLPKDPFVVYTLADYCDVNKQTDLVRFNYCPVCGKEIQWAEFMEDKA